MSSTVITPDSDRNASVSTLQRTKNLTPGNDPDTKGFFGPHGGCFVPPALAQCCGNLPRPMPSTATTRISKKGLIYYLTHYSCRATPCSAATTFPATWAVSPSA